MNALQDCAISGTYLVVFPFHCLTSRHSSRQSAALMTETLHHPTDCVVSPGCGSQPVSSADGEVAVDGRGQNHVVDEPFETAFVARCLK